MNFEINYVDLMASLEIMWKGMAGIFLVCGFIMLFTMFLLKIVKPKQEKKEEGQ
ncbi:MAG: hypothetical protein FWC01_02285 [Treponema sp.]|nr:hypothetical protein [Treponema sp.]MCL2237164.1 hypothetical protein [Treponema sp.]